MSGRLVPAKIMGIFVLFGQQVAIAIQPFTPLSEEQASCDPYRHWDFEFSGRLFYNRCEDLAFARTEDLKGHFGKTFFEIDAWKEYIHVLPINKVR